MVINIADLIEKGQYTSSLSYWAACVIALCDRITALEWALCCSCCFCCFLSRQIKKILRHGDLILKNCNYHK